MYLLAYDNYARRRTLSVLELMILLHKAPTWDLALPVLGETTRQVEWDFEPQLQSHFSTGYPNFFPPLVIRN